MPVLMWRSEKWRVASRLRNEEKARGENFLMKHQHFSIVVILYCVSIYKEKAL